jgi:hypothetical protein
VLRPDRKTLDEVRQVLGETRWYLRPGLLLLGVLRFVARRLGFFRRGIDT